MADRLERLPCVNAAYDAAQWHEFAVAVAGATAALLGLLFVATSINVREILSDSRNVHRAISTLVALATPLVIAVLLLIPGQPNTALGIELVVVGLLAGALLVPLNSLADLSPHRTKRQWLLASAVPIALLVVPTVIGGIGAATETLGGLYWLPAAVIITVLERVGPGVGAADRDPPLIVAPTIAGPHRRGGRSWSSEVDARFVRRSGSAVSLVAPSGIRRSASPSRSIEPGDPPTGW